jgi:DNA (cytosine-5)-methyltransferase 1
MSNFKDWNLNGTVDLVVGGTPCQSFSVAGLRKGLEDPRGNLALTFCAILNKFRPKWFVWENVPGVLSSGGGRDFGSFLGAVAELGYGFSYRVLDAQNFGVPQRRRRVFVVGHFGDWKPTAKVLFESESLLRDSEKSTKKGESITSDITEGPTRSGPNASRVTPMLHQNVIDPLCARDYKGISSDGLAHKAIVEKIAYSADKAPTLTSSAAGISRVGNDTTADSQYVAVDLYNLSVTGDKTTTVTTTGGGTSTGPSVMKTYALQGSGTTSQSGNGNGVNEEKCFTLNQIDVHGIANSMAVRRLTPTECERLQGFPDGYTNIKDNCPDGPRYKSLGNSMAVPVMKWIGQRIDWIDR